MIVIEVVSTTFNYDSLQYQGLQHRNQQGVQKMYVFNDGVQKLFLEECKYYRKIG